MALYDVTPDGTVTTDGQPAQSSTDWLSQLAQGFAEFKLANQQANAAAQVNSINIQRAQQGLPPINVDLSAGAPTVAVGLSPQVQSLLQLALWGGLALLALNIVLKAWRRG